MKGVNKVTLIGTTGKAAELRYFDNGSCIATCSMATNDYWTDKKTGQKMERTEWHSLIWRSKSAEIAAQYVDKGRRLYIEGQIQSRMAKRRDGTEFKLVEIVVREWQLLDNHLQNKSTDRVSPPPQRSSSPQTAPSQPGFGDMDDDIPFAPLGYRQIT
ncbi:single-stranded DNA-binding protein [Kistimonas scapharcae]|uniref:Single-stranded DNA-binding protein n=1 Tax=Kistimonas scapharcae TaxID=1036133 RepID=A0ABP8V077_9GAMM